MEHTSKEKCFKSRFSRISNILYFLRIHSPIRYVKEDFVCTVHFRSSHRYIKNRIYNWPVIFHRFSSHIHYVCVSFSHCRKLFFIFAIRNNFCHSCCSQIFFYSANVGSCNIVVMLLFAITKKNRKICFQSLVRAALIQTW